MGELLYSSTRGGESGCTASEAVLKGLAKDGGLFMPERIPRFDFALPELKDASYQEVAYRVMRLLLTDYSEEELRACIEGAYDEKFDTPEIAPLTFADDAYYLELFHGKTIAFKDMALSILPYLMTTAAKKNGVTNKIEILTATSGDTGKAAMAGFADVPGTGIVVFYPKGVVSSEGNFDDAQTAVKQIFGDRAFEAELAAKKVQLSSANSINIGRLVPQIVYYVHAYLELLKEEKITEGEEINVCVPTGNFGNILAAYFAKRMGLPIDKLICASNDNKVLFDFFETGVYDKNRDFILTTSPSMDILVSSNLERLLYLSAGCDAAKTKALMEALQSGGKYALSAEMRAAMADFAGGFATQEEVAERIRSLYEKTGYVIDTHAAVASKVYDDYRKTSGDTKPTVIASTASPFKFSRAVMEAIAGDVSALDDFAVLDELRKKAGIPFPPAVEEIRNAEVRHTRSCKPEEMKEQVREILFS